MLELRSGITLETCESPDDPMISELLGQCPGGMKPAGYQACNDSKGKEMNE